MADEIGDLYWGKVKIDGKAMGLLMTEINTLILHNKRNTLIKRLASNAGDILSTPLKNARKRSLVNTF